MYKILIVEDDNTIAERLASHLKKWNYKTVCVRDFKNVMEEFKKTDPQLVILDIGLPLYNGFYWCQEIRKLSNVPILFLSSMNDNMNIVMAMNMGGDDFIAKPVDLTVMMAKIQAMLRRTYDMGGKIPVLEHQGAVLNLNDAVLTYQGKQLELTKNEFRILQTLLEQKGKIVSRETLMMKLWQVDSYVEENTLTVNVTRLRKKLEQIGLGGWIRTKVGSGYLIEKHKKSEWTSIPFGFFPIFQIERSIQYAARETSTHPATVFLGAANHGIVFGFGSGDFCTGLFHV